ncbi:Lymphocyte cytosolic protein 2 [Sciurus carolinensis]|uniref:Lymphocyte cytosolic protein 2 n=1 Tax=Sciurus carolinensis TaxID=30640 RepID=A0AA41NJI5_SCICA|nr:Lymphocyte cytosolic protein 2 [Sciurus carolinensis]
MALRNVPFRSEVLAWDSDSLADYFKKLNYKDCEKAVKRHNIDGARFLNLTENDIQKFPKLRVPILSKLSQEINKNEERRSIFTRRPPVQRFPEETESHEEDGGWSSFEDDYESPNDDDQEEEDDGDYESPNEEEEAPVLDDADYEPPPSNDEEALQNAILPAKPLPTTNSMYIDRPPAGKAPQQPPVPPQRPMAALPPLPVTSTGRNHSDGTFLVRDSSKKTITNPYVLMVLYKDKVYNIQIRYQEESQVYFLGTGLHGKEDFLSVSDIIDYFRKMPLLLIDGKNRGSRYQCALTHAAGCP